MAAPRRKPKPPTTKPALATSAGRSREAPVTAATATGRLAELFQRNGYTRVPRKERLKEGSKNYKKGWEVRLILNSEEEMEEARQLLAEVGLRAGRPFRKANQWAQPIYGKEAVDFFEPEGGTP